MCLDKSDTDRYGNDPVPIGRFTLVFEYSCDGYVVRRDDGQYPCVPSSTPVADKNIGRPQGCGVGNPINPAYGNKFQEEQDYTSAKKLSFVRYYDSTLTRTTQFPLSNALGTNWRHGFDKRLHLQDRGFGRPPTVVWSVREDGKVLRFILTNGQWIPDQDVADQLEQTVGADGTTVRWTYRYGTFKEDVFDGGGRLVATGDRNGYTQTLTYSDTTTPVTIAPSTGLLIGMTDSFGQALHFTYDAQGRMSTMADPSGAIYRYAYDASNKLASVTYPDNKVRQYLYENADFPDALTGIVDENGQRFASWAYDAQGRAISSEHAGGAERVTVAYSTTGATVTDALGTARAFGFQTVQGVAKNVSFSQPGGSGCAAAASAVTYDANGNVASRTDFNGNQTTYEYDLTRNLETRRVEAAGTPQARTITTEWHATYRLPTRIAEPKRITINQYDAKGNLLSKTLQATSDATGAQGFSASVLGMPRTRSYTYNDFGQVLTDTDPRDGTTAYSYDGQGSLTSITNAAGHVTSLSNYDANGRVGRMVDPNGLTTDLTYSPRGWLIARTVGGETTSYDYDGVGQLKTIGFPEGSSLSYTYDGAHRLTGLADSAGNRITYTLDAMGNRISEQVKDPNGALARQTTRVYDALNRLQQITGGVQ
jgi:YD repeat-containing protein